MEGYDYPPNLSESFSDWWSLSSKKKKEQEKEDKKGFLPRSFAQAISNSAEDCVEIYQHVNDGDDEDKEENANNEEENEEEDEEDEDVKNLIKTFDSWAKCYKNIDQGKAEMDSMMMKEFNAKLEKLLNEEFKKVHTLRKRVKDSRLKFDTVRYELKVKEEKAKIAEAAASNAAVTLTTTEEEKPEEEEKPTTDIKKEEDLSLIHI